MDKYRLLRERVAALTDSGIELAQPLRASDEDLLRAHDTQYVNQVCAGTLDRALLRRIGFPWSVQMIERSRRSSGGTMAALRAAMLEGVAVNLAGGTHHARSDRGGGYCVFNDTVVAARWAQGQRLLDTLLVVDLDVHQGDGTAEICRGDSTIFTLSLHAERNYPLDKQSSDLDVALPDGTKDADYLLALEQALAEARARFNPDAVIYLAGADPYQGDRLGRLSLSREGLRERDRKVLEWCERQGLPVAVSMAGGYAEDVEVIVDIHLGTVLEANVSHRRRVPHWRRADP